MTRKPEFVVKIGIVEWVYLSPHFDDVALSCGGLVWEQSQSGQPVRIWTICAGEPIQAVLTPFAHSLHERWGVEQLAVESRREEDQRACQRLGAAHRHFPIPDCIYRGSTEPLYSSEASLWGELHPAEESLVYALSVELSRPLSEDAELVCPLVLGNHVDHQLTRQAAERLGRPLWYYADYPYVLENAAELDRLAELGWEAKVFPVSTLGLEAWMDSIAAYASQISTFWIDLAAMRQAILKYSREQGGVPLWRPCIRERKLS